MYASHLVLHANRVTHGLSMSIIDPCHTHDLVIS